jgi:hypothetical protein
MRILKQIHHPHHLVIVVPLLLPVLLLLIQWLLLLLRLPIRVLSSTIRGVLHLLLPPKAVVLLKK